LRVAAAEDASGFRDAENGYFGVVGDDIGARGAHLRSAHAENFHVRSLLQLGGKARGIHVSARFAAESRIFVGGIEKKKV